jgi:hypothetical protein
VDYKATLLVPEDLRMASATPRLKKGRSATLQGTLAVPVSAAPGAAVAWAAKGTLVTVQRKKGAAWTAVKNVRTGANGAWRLKVRVSRTTQWRAVAQPVPGLPVEYSVVKRTVVAH